jgi:hypothetical protein
VSTVLRSRVGETATCALDEKGTRLTSKVDGSALTKALAAAVAAPRREGETSVATIEPDVSIARMTVPCRFATVTARSGRARPTISVASAARKRTVGTTRRQAGTCGTTERRTSTFVNATA